MTKKEFGKKVLGATKILTSAGVGIGAMFVTETICSACSPAAAASTATKVGYKIGTKGVSMVTGAVATDLTKQELDAIESRTKLMILKGKELKKGTKTEEVETA